jgi:ribosomal protein S18 acetylase RimI-like enzyme
MMQLRQALPADADELGCVHVQAWRETYQGLMPDAVLAALDPAQRAAMWRDVMGRGMTVRLAELEGQIVGFGASGPQRDASLPFAGEVHAIYVLQRAQRLGVGRRLMAAMARDLLARGTGSCLLWVLEANTPARRFYAALGGREVARREQARDGFTDIGIAYAWDDLTSLT